MTVVGRTVFTARNFHCQSAENTKIKSKPRINADRSRLYSKP
jgi:hypothetical protein